MKVKVKDDATMWGEPGAALSSYAGRVGVVVEGYHRLDGYDVGIDFGDGNKDFFPRFYWRELEILERDG